MMADVLIVYGTGQGQTAKIAAHVDSLLSVRGFNVTTMHVEATSDVDPENFDAVLVGASVNSGRHQPKVVAFAKEHRDALASRPSGFFQVSLGSAIPSILASEGAGETVQEMVETTGWHPDRVGLFAGALRYTQYNWPMRVAFKLASIPMGLGTDTARDYEYTVWSEVEEFADGFAAFVEFERGTVALEPVSDDSGRSGRRLAGLAAVGLAFAGGVYWARRRSKKGPSVVREDEATERPASEATVIDAKPSSSTAPGVLLGRLFDDAQTGER